ncbi:MAG: outer membrane lipoprotein carrier protein LolA [Desulfovibrio sp.]|jgi:outer membrane lipoprotein-sorting protein|nr:outer membrane lipoprotein carrier protein LolA [Desulfovibrio sp.]
MKIKAILCLCLCFGGISLGFARLCCAVPETAATLARLQTLTSSIVTLQCNFTQRTDILLFVEPVVSKGKMRFHAPDKLVWEIEKPLNEGFVLNGGSGYRWERSKAERRAFKTSDDPLAALVGKQLRAWLTFDQKWLLSKYAITVEGEAPMRLSLTPKNADAASLISAIRITFNENGAANSVELQESKGNKTVIQFEDIHVNESIEEREFE